MVCSKCGYSCDEALKYCGVCGNPLKQSNQREKNFPKKIVGFILGITVLTIVTIALIVGLFIWLYVPKTIDLNKYVYVEFDGYDTVGTAQVVFDEEKFWLDYGDKIEFNHSAAARQFNNLYAALGNQPIEGFLSCIHVNVSKTEGLSNDDIIYLEWNCNDLQIENYFNYRIEYTEVEYIVDGLKEVHTFNPFENISISFSGISSNGQVLISNNSSDDIYSNLAFSVDKTSGLSNGDEIIISLETRDGRDVITYCAEEYGLVPDELIKIYTVQELGHYVTQLNEIPEEILDAMNQQSQDAITSYVVNNWESCNTLNSVTYLGSHFLAPKNGITVETQNIVYMVYVCQCTVTASNSLYGTGSEDYNFYFVVRYDNVVIEADGSCYVDIFNYIIPDNRVKMSVNYQGSSRGRTYTTYGFVNVDSVFKECVESKISEYTYESTVEDIVLE